VTAIAERPPGAVVRPDVLRQLLEQRESGVGGQYRRLRRRVAGDLGGTGFGGGPRSPQPGLTDVGRRTAVAKSSAVARASRQSSATERGLFARGPPLPLVDLGRDPVATL